MGEVTAPKLNDSETNGEEVKENDAPVIKDSVRHAVDQLRTEVSEVAEDLKQRFNHLPEDLKDRFYRLQGQLFHAVRTINGANYMYRYRIGLDGKLTLEEKLKGIYVTGRKIEETRKKLLKAGKAVPIRARGKWRETVTGDHNKRIRDYMKETPQVKMLDKFSFTLGVLIICLSEWLLLRVPQLFPTFYVVLMSLLLVWRFFDYKTIKSELYLLDFCYFVNLSVAMQVLFYPSNQMWFDANYVLSLGPICLAIVVWQNSLVFHSLDKVTSFFLHAFPPVVCHGLRWNLISNEMPLGENSTMSLKSHIIHPLALYVVWQVGYLFITEIVLRQHLQSDKSIVTSVRYLTRDRKNPIVYRVTNICAKYGLVKAGECLDPETNLAKGVFVCSQIIYTLLTILHTNLLYMSYMTSCIYIISIFGIGVWNGASYYIEIFSKRYNLQFVEKTHDSDTERSERAQSETTDPDSDLEEEDFVEALESLDLNEPQHMQKYTNFLEPLVTTADSNPSRMT